MTSSSDVCDNTHDRFYQVSVDAREELKNGRVDPELLARLYHDYNPIPDMDVFIERALGMFPKLCCGLASLYLRYRLNEGVVHYGWYEEERHTFLVAQGWVLDITADQFGGPPTYVGPLAPPWLACRMNSETEHTLNSTMNRQRGSTPRKRLPRINSLISPSVFHLCLSVAKNTRIFATDSHGLNTDRERIAKSRILVEEAVFSKKRLENLAAVRSICVVISECHIERARLIFEHFFEPTGLTFVGTPDAVSPERLAQLKAHEEMRIDQIKQQGGILFNGKLFLRIALC